MEWIEKYPKKSKPAYDDLLEFLQPHIRDLFESFDREMNVQFQVHNKYHRYSNSAGWVYGYGRSYNCELLAVTIHSDYFSVLGISVKDGNSLQKALKEARNAYDQGFEDRYAAISAERRKNQIERTKKRIDREKAQMERLRENTDETRLNQFKWCRKVSRKDLLRLYQGEAAGLIDQELLEEIGYTFYARCRQAKEVRELMEEGKLLCLHCGAVLKPSGYTSPVHCECGYCYTYREYRRSCNTANMPGGRAAPIFETFAQKWPSCRETSQKMMLIDWLIHECHVTLMSGLKGRSVCVNLIEGTLKQISDLIVKLAG